MCIDINCKNIYFLKIYMKIEDEIKQPLFKSEYNKMVINIIFTAGWINQKVHCYLKEYDLSPQQYNILRILRGQHPGNATITTIQDRMLDKMSNASRLVEKLRIKQYVTRDTDENDRRQVKVKITEKGLDLLKITDIESEKYHNFSDVLTIEEAQALNNLLDKLRD